MEQNVYVEKKKELILYEIENGKADTTFNKDLSNEIRAKKQELKENELRLEKSGNYLRFTGCYNLNGKHFLVHRAVWEAFNGPIPEGCDIDHIDGNPKNNSLENLQAITHSENIKKRNIDYSYAANNFYRG